MTPVDSSSQPGGVTVATRTTAPGTIDPPPNSRLVVPVPGGGLSFDVAAGTWDFVGANGLNVNGAALLTGGTPWIPVLGGIGFQNGWTNHTPGTYPEAAYRVIPALNCLQLKGAIKSGTVNTAAFTLPVNARPARTVYVVAYSQAPGDTTGAVVVSTNGTVGILTNLGNTFVNLQSALIPLGE